ncbi:MAG: addiction module protein [Planctomycetes bacterium]|nr:addiction module protein [Planctomycetota bacterium]
MASLLTEQQLSQLSVEERIRLIGVIWDTLQGDDASVPEWHRKIVEERLKRMEEDPREGVSWDEIKEELRLKREARAQRKV